MKKRLALHLAVLAAAAAVFTATAIAKFSGEPPSPFTVGLSR